MVALTRCLEWNVVLRGGRTGDNLVHASLRLNIFFAAIAWARSIRACVAAAQKHHIVGYHFGRVVLPVFLVGPLASLQATFHEALPTLSQVLAAQLSQLSPHYNPMPLRSVLLLTILVGPRFAGCDSEIRNRLTTGVNRTSGSAPRLPTRITLLTPPAILFPAFLRALIRCGSVSLFPKAIAA